MTTRTDGIDRSPPMMAAPGTTASGDSDSRSIDETEYLMQHPANARRLRESIKQAESLKAALRKSAE